jgi:hypothetical protein
MNHTFMAAVAALMLAVGFAGSAAAQTSTFSERFLFRPIPPDEDALNDAADQY